MTLVEKSCGDNSCGHDGIQFKGVFARQIGYTAQVLANGDTVQLEYYQAWLANNTATMCLSDSKALDVSHITFGEHWQGPYEASQFPNVAVGAAIDLLNACSSTGPLSQRVLEPVLATVLAAAHRSSESIPRAPPDTPCGGFATDAARGWVDGCGRQRFFWGVNVVYKGYPWLPQSSPFDFASSFTPDDAAFVRSFGCNSIRLGTMWPGVQPDGPGTTDAAYIARVVDTVTFAGAQGVFSLLDAHQDVMSAQTCGEGLPGWAAADFSAGASAFPLPLNKGVPFTVNASGIPSPADCAKFSWSEYYSSDAVCKMSQELYARGAAAFGAFWAAVAAAVTGSPSADPFVIAYELLNEPWAGDIIAHPGLLVPGVADRENLQPFYFNVTAAIRAAEVPGHSHAIAVESVTWDDFIPVGFTALPGGPSARALSYHYYSAPNIEGAEGQVRSGRASTTKLT
jgi:hypothetical protein